MVKITRRIHWINGLEHPFGIEVAVYVVEEKGPRDLTLVDSGFLAGLSKLDSLMQDEGYEMKDVKRIVFTHTHIDHTQAGNEIKKKTGATSFSHWIEAAYLQKDPMYNGPPNHETIEKIASKLGIKMDDITKRFGPLTRDAIVVDKALNDGDSVGSLKIIHSPGHTPGHIALFSEEDSAIIGGDFLFKSVLGNESLYVPSYELSFDPLLGAVSARRISRLHFDKLLLGHQDAPLLENASASVERAANDIISTVKPPS